MMRYTLLLILSLLTANTGLGYSSGTNSIKTNVSGSETKTVSNVLFISDISLLDSKEFEKSSIEKYPIQLGAFKNKANAEALCKKITANSEIKAKIIFEDGLYKVRITRLPSNRDALYSEARIIKDKVNSNSSDSSGSKTSTRSPVSLNDNPPLASFISNMVDTLGDKAEKVHRIWILNGNSPWLKKINYHGKSVGFVNALILAIILSISTMIMLLMYILLNRRRMEKEESLHQYLMEKYQGLIIDYLFGNTGPDEFKPIASDNYRRQVLIDQMIDVSINLKGGEGTKLLTLYKYLGLDRDSIARARDIRWHIKIKGFRELAFMNIKDANDSIYAALNSSNEILRMEAQIALVRLTDENPFEFLSYLNTPFSLWEQITLHELIIQHNIKVPSFQKWLTSSNPTVVMFALRMIREFKQKESEEKVRETLMHPDQSVRRLAVQVAGDLNMHSTLEAMKHMYKNQDYSVCLEIIRSMGKMPDASMIGFLKLVLDKEDDVQLQIEATKAIENNGEEGVKTLVKLMKSEYKNYNIIIRHVLDRRIY